MYKRQVLGYIDENYRDGELTELSSMLGYDIYWLSRMVTVSYTHLDVYKRQGKESPYRNRSIEENLKLFEEMKEGKYQDGEKAVSYTHLDVYKRQV